LLYILEADPDITIIGTVRDGEEALVSPFTSGTAFPTGGAAVQPRVSIELAPEQYPDYFELQQIPIVSQGFLDALASAGVDNFVAYPVTLQESARAVPGHSVLHIIGRVAALDEGKSNVTRLGRQIMRMRRLALKSNITTDLPMFRLHELHYLILLAQRVRDAVAKLTGVVTSEAEGWSDSHQF
jgi:hypothetical protein